MASLRYSFKYYLLQHGFIHSDQLDLLTDTDNSKQLTQFTTLLEESGPMMLRDMAERVFKAWEAQVQERILSECLRVGLSHFLVTKAKAFWTWKQKAPRSRKQPVQYDETKLKKHSQAEEILASPSKSPESTRYRSENLLSSIGNDLKVMSSAEIQRESLYERLHKEAELKSAFIKRARALKESQELNKCTFKPEINKSPVRQTLPVHERLFFSQKRIVLEDFDSLEEKQLEECTFSPSINYSAKSTGSVERFEMWEQNRLTTLRRRQLDRKGMELDGCTFKPETTSKRPAIEDASVFEHLYNTHLTKQKKKRQQEAERYINSTHRSPLRTSISSPRPSQDSGRLSARNLGQRDVTYRFVEHPEVQKKLRKRMP